MDDIAERVKAVITNQLGSDPELLVPEAIFTQDLNADSLDTVELVVRFEQEFGVDIPEDAAGSLSTVGATIEFIKERTGLQ